MSLYRRHKEGGNNVATGCYFRIQGGSRMGLLLWNVGENGKVLVEKVELLGQGISRGNSNFSSIMARDYIE